MQCPIARSLERVGEWWSILILREAFYGSKRFDDFQRRLDIAPNMLTRRLTGLVEEGLLARQQYSERPPRYEYVLTESGRDFAPVMFALLAWGNRHFAPEGLAVELTDLQTGEKVDPVVVDRATGLPLDGRRHVPTAGPAATDELRERLDRVAEYVRNLPVRPASNDDAQTGRH